MASQKEVAIIIRAIDKASKVMEGISAQGTRALRGLAVGAAAVTAAFAAVGAGYGMLIKGGIEYNTRLENYRALLTGIFQSQSKANKEMEWAIKLAAKTPYEIPDIVEAQAKMEAYGISARKLLPFLADMAAATGKSILQAVEAVADAQMGEFERLKEFTIKKELLIPYGLETDAKGAVTNIDSITDSIVRFGTEVRRWTGQTAIISNTFRGLASNLKDIWGGILGTLAEPAFEQIKEEMRDVLAWATKLRDEGRVAELLKGWSDAGGEAIKVISALGREIGKDLLEAIEKSGNSVRDWIMGLDIEKLKNAIRQVADFAKQAALLSIKITKLVADNWKLIAVFGGLLILTNITVKLLAFTKAVILVTGAVKAWSIANSALILTLGPTGIIVGLIAIAAFLATKYIPSLDKAAKKTRELVTEALRLKPGMLVPGSLSAVYAHDQIRVAMEAERGEIKNLEASLRGIRALMGASGQAVLRYAEDYNKANLSLKAHREILRQLEEQAKKIRDMASKVKPVKADDVVGGTEPPPAVSDLTRDKLLKELADRAAKYTQDQYTYEFKEAEAYYSKLEQKYAEDAEMSKLIATAKSAQLADIRLRERAEVADAVREVNQLREDASAKEIEIAQQAVIAGIEASGRQQAEYDKVAEAGIKTQEAIMGAQHTAYIRGLELEGRFTEASIQEAQLRAYETYKATGDMETAYKQFNAEVAAIHLAVAEQRKQDDAAVMEHALSLQRRYSDEMVSMAQERADRVSQIQQNAFNAEQNRIASLGREYSGYIQLATGLLKQFSSEQKGAWLRALAMVVRFTSQVVASYLRQRALEKLKQASEMQSQAQWLRDHASRMAALAVEAGILATMAGAAALLGDPRQVAVAAAYGKAAAMAGGEFARATVAAGALEVQAKAVQAEAAGLMAASVAVGTVGEAAARGLEAAADAVDVAAREEEELARRKEQALEAELRLRQEILQLQGRETEAQLMAIDEQARRYREMGVDTTILDTWTRLQAAAEASETSASRVVAITQGATPVTVAGGEGGYPSITMPGTGPASQYVVYQTNNFAGFLDTTDREQLRQLAIMLQPYNEELEDLGA